MLEAVCLEKHRHLKFVVGYFSNYLLQKIKIFFRAVNGSFI